MTRDVAICVDVRSRLMQDLVRNQSSSMESVKTFSRTVNTDSKQTRDSATGSSFTHGSNVSHIGCQITDTAENESQKELVQQKTQIESERNELFMSNRVLKTRLEQIEEDLRAEKIKVENFEKIAMHQSQKQYKSQSCGPAITHVTTSISTSTSSLNVKTVNERRSSSSNGVSTMEVLPVRASSSSDIYKPNSTEKISVIKETVKKTNSLTNKSEKLTTTTCTTAQHIKLCPASDTSIIYIPNGSNMMIGQNKQYQLLGNATQNIVSTHESRLTGNSIIENNTSSLKIQLTSSSPTSVLRNEVKIPINKEDNTKVKSNELFITNVTITKPPISPSRSSSLTKETNNQTTVNDRFVTESSEMVTYKDGEVVEKKIVEK